MDVNLFVVPMTKQLIFILGASSINVTYLCNLEIRN